MASKKVKRGRATDEIFARATRVVEFVVTQRGRDSAVGTVDEARRQFLTHKKAEMVQLDREIFAFEYAVSPSVSRGFFLMVGAASGVGLARGSKRVVTPAPDPEDVMRSLELEGGLKGHAAGHAGGKYVVTFFGPGGEKIRAYPPMGKAAAVRLERKLSEEHEGLGAFALVEPKVS